MTEVYCAQRELALHSSSSNFDLAWPELFPLDQLAHLTHIPAQQPQLLPQGEKAVFREFFPLLGYAQDTHPCSRNPYAQAGQTCAEGITVREQRR